MGLLKFGAAGNGWAVEDQELPKGCFSIWGSPTYWWGIHEIYITQGSIPPLVTSAVAHLLPNPLPRTCQD